MRIEFTIGTGVNAFGEKIHPDTARYKGRQFLREVINSFGGATVTAGIGGWRDGNSNQVIEDVIVVTTDVDPLKVYRQSSSPKAAAGAVTFEAQRLARVAADMFDQTAVHLTFVEAQSSDVYRSEIGE
jgi:hypothetical protein